MRNIRFFFEEDMNINNEYYIWSLIYSKYIRLLNI